MSYDLYVFKGPRQASEEEVGTRLERFADGDEAVFEASPQVALFYDELLRKFPALEDMPEDNLDTAVWAMTPDRSDRLVRDLRALARGRHSSIRRAVRS